MDFDFNESLEAIKKLVNDVAKTAKKATKGAAAVTKAEVSILSEQDKLRKAYLALGKLYYRDYITGEDPDDAEYIPLCDAITEATKNIDELKAKVSEVTSAKKEEAEEPEEPEEPEESEEPMDAEAELNDLHEQLDDLADHLKDLNEAQEAAPEAVFEVVEDRPAEEEKPAE